MLCAAVAHVGPVPLACWAVWDREQRTLAEHTLRRPRGVTVEPGRRRAWPTGRWRSTSSSPRATASRPSPRTATSTSGRASRAASGSPARARSPSRVHADRRRRDRRRVRRLPRAPHLMAVDAPASATAEDGAPVAWNFSSACTTRRRRRSAPCGSAASRTTRARSGSTALDGVTTPTASTSTSASEADARAARQPAAVRHRLRAAVRRLRGNAARAGRLRRATA